MGVSISKQTVHSVTSEGLSRVALTITSATGIATQCIVVRATDDSYSHIASAQDMLHYPVTRAEALSSGTFFYRTNTVTKDWPTNAAANAFAAYADGALRRLARGYALATGAVPSTDNDTFVVSDDDVGARGAAEQAADTAAQAAQAASAAQAQAAAAAAQAAAALAESQALQHQWAVVVGASGKLVQGERIAFVLVDRPVTFVAGELTIAKSRVGAETGCALVVRKNGDTVLGTLIWFAGQSVAVSSVAGSVDAGDLVSIEVATADLALEDVSVVLKGTT